MKNRLIAIVPHVTVYVVSVKEHGDRRPLAAFRSKTEAFDSVKLIGQTDPQLGPRFDTIWMPVSEPARKKKAERGGK